MSVYSALVEGLFDTKKEIEANIKSFNVMPNVTDVSFESWILRLSLYGKISYHYRNTEKRENGDTNFNKFMDVMDRDHVLKTLGEWDVEKTAPDTVVFYKEFWGMDGKSHEEEFVVSVKFRPEVKKILGAF